MTLHFASGAGVDQSGTYAASADGYNLADVQSLDEVNALPSGTKGLVWLNETGGVTQSFIDKVTPFLNNPKVFGFYLADEPDPTGQYGPKVSAADLKAESDWIHSHSVGAKTFITLMNMGSSADPSYANTYNAANTGIDYFGVSAYPVWSDKATPDYDMINRNYNAAVSSGISASQIVPIYQAFGGGNWVTEDGSSYTLPTAPQEQQIIDRWASLDPNPAFDYTYAWNSQQGDTALGQSSTLQSVFAAHNASIASTTATGAGATAGTTSSGGGSSSQPTTTTGSGTTGSSGSSTGTTTTQHATSGGGRQHHHGAQSFAAVAAAIPASDAAIAVSSAASTSTTTKASSGLDAFASAVRNTSPMAAGNLLHGTAASVSPSRSAGSPLPSTFGSSSAQVAGIDFGDAVRNGSHAFLAGHHDG